MQKIEETTINKSNQNEILKRAKLYREKGFGLKDASYGLLFGGFLAPVLVLIVLTIIFSFIAATVNMTYEQLMETKPFDIILMLCAEMGFLAYVLYAYRKSKKDAKSKFMIGFSFKKANLIICGILVALGIILSLFCSEFINLMNYLLSLIGYSKSSNLPFAIDSVPNLILGLVVMAFIPAVCEEFLFRGVVLGGLLNFAKTKSAKIVAVLISALCFALIHQSMLQLVYPLIMGTIFGLVYLYTGNLLYSIILHFVSNAVVIVANFIQAMNGIVPVAPVYDAKAILLAIGMLIVALGIAFVALLLIKKINKKSFLEVTNEEIEQDEKEELLNADSHSQVENKLKEKTAFNFLEKNNITIGKITLIAGIVFGVAMLVIDLITNLI